MSTQPAHDGGHSAEPHSVSTSQAPLMLTMRQKFFLSVGVPLVLLITLELIVRLVIFISSLLEPAPLTRPADLKLEMPTWMARDENAAERTATVEADADALEWLNIFEEGPGFRVRLKPLIEASIVNTFSQIPADRARRYGIRANALGFRGPDLTTQIPPDTYRVVVIGDSSSFGWGVEQADTFWALLERDINNDLAARLSKRRIQVANFAIPGDSSEYGRLIFDALIRNYQYDLLIVGFGANDAKLATTAHAAQVARFSSHSLLHRLNYWLQKSALVRAISALVKQLAPKNPRNKNAAFSQSRKPAVPLERYLQNLSYFADQSLQNGAQAVVILNLCTPPRYSRAAQNLARERRLLYLDGQQLMLNRIEDLKSGTLYADLVAEMRQSYPHELDREPRFFVTSDSCHPNRAGHRIVADRLREIVGPLAAAPMVPTANDALAVE